VHSPADPLLPLADAADALGTGPDFISHLITTGQLDHVDRGDGFRVPQSALIAYAITTGDSSEDAEPLAAHSLSATFAGQEAAA
jgi:hypothetical protein